MTINSIIYGFLFLIALWCFYLIFVKEELYELISKWRVGSEANSLRTSIKLSKRYAESYNNVEEFIAMLEKKLDAMKENEGYSFIAGRYSYDCVKKGNTLEIKREEMYSEEVENKLKENDWL